MARGKQLQSGNAPPARDTKQISAHPIASWSKPLYFFFVCVCRIKKPMKSMEGAQAAFPKRKKKGKIEAHNYSTTSA